MHIYLITEACTVGTEWDSGLVLCMPCSINSYSDASTENVCVPCMSHYSTGSIGSSICTPCPVTHVRPYYERVCRECTPGMSVNHTVSSGCVQCEHNMINIGGMETCVFCDDLHVSDKTQTMLPRDRQQYNSAVRPRRLTVISLWLNGESG